MKNKSTIAILLTATATLAAIASCNKDGSLNAQLSNQLIGEQGTHLLEAGSHTVNANALSEKDEPAIGESVGLAITNRYGTVNNDNLQRYVNLVGLTVASASPNATGNWVFGVINSNDVNAFSGPNGYVFITLGAIRQMKDEAELAGVLAHEVAHVSNHDGLAQIKAAEGRGALNEFVQAGGARTSQFSALTDMGVNVLTQQSYSQPQENKADTDAVHIMSAAGYDPQSYLRFLQRMAQAGATAGGGKILSTHPDIQGRIRNVNDTLRTIRPGGATVATRFTQRTAGT